MNLRNITIKLIAVAVCLGTQAFDNPTMSQGGRKIDPSYYTAPLEGKILLAGNFAEARTDHFHSGVDIKTDGVEGKPLCAVADGYISRVNISPFGFGRAIYIAHPNGTTSVYAHMQKFTPEVEKLVAERRHATKSHSGDMYTEANAASPRFPVKQGERIGWAGNSGSSSGPHLHFELRESGSQRPLNVAAMKIYDIKDDLHPMIVRLHYVEVDTVKGVPVTSPPRAIDVMSTSAGHYRLADTSVVRLGRCGYFVLEATDRKNETQNTMGIYSVRLKLDAAAHFSFHLNSFLFSETRYVNSLTHYGMQKGEKNEFLRLAVQAGNMLPIYSSVKDRGAIVLRDDDTHEITLEVEDDNWNVSTLSFRVALRADGKVFSPDQPAGSIATQPRKAFSHSAGGLSVSIPADALYEPVFYTQAVDSVTKGKRTMYSPIYTVHDEQVPLHKAATISIAVKDVPANLQSKLTFACIAPDGKYSHALGKYENGRVTGTVRRFGRYAVTVDNSAPTITPSFEDGADLKGKQEISFTLRDDFSGVSYFSATIDGKWIPFEQKGAVITHIFDNTRISYKGGTHNLVITVSDSKGNSTTLKRSFVR